MLVVSINVESWKECATTSISSPQERNCIAELCGKKGSFIGCIAHKTGKDSSSVCHKVEKNERHKRFSACATQRRAAARSRQIQAEKEALRSCARSSWRSVDPQADRRHLRLEGGGRCAVELLDYSAGRSMPPLSSCQEWYHLRRKGKRVRSKRPKTQGKVEISH
ncbi:MAG: hypothetical protein ACFNZW_09090, partial [Coriobacteriaceae bacterium]